MSLKYSLLVTTTQITKGCRQGIVSNYHFELIFVQPSVMLCHMQTFYSTSLKLVEEHRSYAYANDILGRRHKQKIANS